MKLFQWDERIDKLSAANLPLSTSLRKTQNVVNNL